MPLLKKYLLDFVPCIECGFAYLHCLTKIFYYPRELRTWKKTNLAFTSAQVLLLGNMQNQHERASFDFRSVASALSGFFRIHPWPIVRRAISMTALKPN